MNKTNVNSRKILLVGWDAADWKIINPLVDSGKMPNLKQLIETGIMGNLATINPQLSPMLWTSIATGKRPFKHGILGFTEPAEGGAGIQPVTNLSRKTRALWNIYTILGLKCNVVGWWPSHPVEPINGVMVSDHYHKAVSPFGKPWPMKKGNVHPKRLIRNFQELRVHPQELDVGLVELFLPHLSEIDQDKDKRVEKVARIIAEASTISRATQAVMHYEPWDLTAAYFDSIDHFCHLCMKYHPPRLPWINEQDFRFYYKVVESGYILHDIFLGRLLEETDEDTFVILVSDHGFHSDHLRKKGVPNEPAGPAADHRSYGVIVMKGPGIKKDELIFGATLLDICPTILYAKGLPIGEDMDGKPLLNAFEKPEPVQTIKTWDDVEGNDGGHPKNMKIDPVEAQEELDQLVALGYIDPPDANIEKRVQETIREHDYNHARSLMDAGRHYDASLLLEKLYQHWSNEYRFGTNLITCYNAMGQVKKMRPLLEGLVDNKNKDIPVAKKELEEFIKEKKEKIDAQELSETEKRKMSKLRSRAKINPDAINFLKGSVFYGEKKYNKALTFFALLENRASFTTDPSIALKIGDCHFKLKNWEDAIVYYEKALAIDFGMNDALAGLSRTYFSLKKYKQSAEYALDSIGLKFHNPFAHFLLGRALYRMKDVDNALKAINLSISQNPNFPAAYAWLALIYKQQLKSYSKAKYYRKQILEAMKRIHEIRDGKIGDIALSAPTRKEYENDMDITEIEPIDPKNTIVVVSGLPRSGTSMMMQMLAAGGLNILTDNIREADSDNPQGYYEHEKIKSLNKDNSWVAGLKGKAVKIISQLVYYLPANRELDFRVILMDRHLDEVIASQKKMLENLDRSQLIADKKLFKIYKEQSNRVKIFLNRHKIPFIIVNYSDMFSDSHGQIKRICKFLGIDADMEEMVKVVNPELYRQRLN